MSQSRHPHQHPIPVAHPPHHHHHHHHSSSTSLIGQALDALVHPHASHHAHHAHVTYVQPVAPIPPTVTQVIYVQPAQPVVALPVQQPVLPAPLFLVGQPVGAEVVSACPHALAPMRHRHS